MKIIHNNIEYYLKKFHFSPTYDGMFGNATSALNKMIINEIELPKDWVNIPFTLINVSGEKIEDVLPYSIVYAWLTTDTTVSDKEACGSHLVIGWFDDFNNNQIDFNSMLQSKLDLITWSEKAEDFDY